MKYDKSTNTEQARRLLNCGVDGSTADMSWREIIDLESEETVDIRLSLMPYEDAKVIYGEKGIAPAWSLSALLALMPSCIRHGNTEYYLDFAPYKDKGWGIGYYNNEGVRSIKGLTYPSDPIEACVTAIEWLCRNCYKLNTISE